MGSVGFHETGHSLAPIILPHQEHFTISLMTYLLSELKKALPLTFVERSERGPQVVMAYKTRHVQKLYITSPSLCLKDTVTIHSSGTTDTRRRGEQFPRNQDIALLRLSPGPLELSMLLFLSAWIPFSIAVLCLLNSLINRLLSSRFGVFRIRASVT